MRKPLWKLAPNDAASLQIMGQLVVVDHESDPKLVGQAMALWFRGVNDASNKLAAADAVDR